MTHAIDNARFIELWNAGMPTAEMAVVLNCGQSTISDWRKRLKLEARHPSSSKRTPEDLERIRVLWSERGLSSADVAAAMGPGWTRNAVIGLIHRNKFAKLTRQKASAPARMPRVEAPKPKPQPAPKPFDLSKSKTDSTPEQRTKNAAAGQAIIAKVEASQIKSPNARPFLEHKTGCKWPIGAGMSMLYCCNPTVGGTGAAKVYCAEHHRIAVSSVQPYRPRSPVSSFTRHDRIATPRPKPANDPFGSTWDDERAVA